MRSSSIRRTNTIRSGFITAQHSTAQHSTAQHSISHNDIRTGDDYLILHLASHCTLTETTTSPHQCTSHHHITWQWACRSAPRRCSQQTPVLPWVHYSRGIDTWTRASDTQHCQTESYTRIRHSHVFSMKVTTKNSIT